MLEDLARLPPNVGASVERALVEAERTLAVAETQPPDYVFSGGTRASDIAVPTVLGVVAVGVGLATECREKLAVLCELQDLTIGLGVGGRVALAVAP